MLPPPDVLPEGAPRLQSDRYVLLARVGKGGMAGVYAAWDVREQDWRAIKVMLPRFARDQGIRNRFEKEGVTMAALAHPNLVRVFEIGEAKVQEGPPLPFIVMELLNGGSLHRWVKTYGKMPPQLAVRASIQLLQGLESVHAAGVVHRDVKPKNVLSDDASVLKLTDFGIAQLEASNETKTGLAMGTLGYMAPEQLHDARSVDPRSDLYAVAATAWTLLTTQKPRDLFRLEDRPDLMTEVPECLRSVLSRCLSYERTDRPESARAVADELRGLLHELPDDPPGTPDLSLHLGMPDIKSIPKDAFSELSLSSRGVFQEGTSGTDPYGSRLGAPLVPGGGDEKPRKAAEAPAPGAGRRLGARQIPTERPAPEYVEIGVDEAPAAGPPPPSYADLRRRSDARAEIPSYVADPEYRDEPLPPPPVQVVRSTAPAKAMGVLGALALLAVGTTFALGVGIAAYGANAARSVRAAEAAFAASAEDLDRHIGWLDTLPQEVAALGVDATELREVYAAWSETEPGVERASLAIRYVHVAEREALPRIPPTDRTHEQELVHQRLDRASKSVDATEYALGEWRAAAEGPAAELAVTLRLATPPPGVRE
jgi:serine/threonine protein kinase